MFGGGHFPRKPRALPWADLLSPVGAMIRKCADSQGNVKTLRQNHRRATALRRVPATGSCHVRMVGFLIDCDKFIATESAGFARSCLLVYAGAKKFRGVSPFITFYHFGRAFSASECVPDVVSP